VKWNDNLFCGGDIAPLLVAACRPSECETVTAENRNDLASRQARRSAVTPTVTSTSFAFGDSSISAGER
jgi:hypothetical protein